MGGGLALTSALPGEPHTCPSTYLPLPTGGPVSWPALHPGGGVDPCPHYYLGTRKAQRASVTCQDRGRGAQEPGRSEEQ